MIQKLHMQLTSQNVNDVAYMVVSLQIAPDILNYLNFFLVWNRNDHPPTPPGNDHDALTMLDIKLSICRLCVSNLYAQLTQPLKTHII